MRKLIGDKKFYRLLFTIALPLIIQQGLTSFVSLLDNVMVGSLGTNEMSGVAIVNQILLVVSLGTYGILSGASIFTSQYFGAQDFEGVKHSFHFKVIVSFLMIFVSILTLTIFKDDLIRAFINGDSTLENKEEVFSFAISYLNIMIYSLPFFIFTQCYATTLRESKNTFFPLISSIVSIITNLTLNFILIFGMLGAPKLGVVGAAIATFVARIVETTMLIIPFHFSKKYYYFKGIYKNLYVPWKLSKEIIKKGTPLFLNEVLWSSGMTILFKIYSTRGLDAVASFNISSTISNLFIIIFQAIGSSVCIIIGPLLGCSDFERAKRESRWLYFAGMVSAFISGVLLIIFSSLIPNIYNVSDEIKHNATNLLRVFALCMPLYSFSMISYFTLRSGGVTIVTFLFDSVFVWVISIPIAIIFFEKTSLKQEICYFFVQASEIIKVIIGGALVGKGIWLNNIIKIKKKDKIPLE